MLTSPSCWATEGPLLRSNKGPYYAHLAHIPPRLTCGFTLSQDYCARELRGTQPWRRSFTTLTPMGRATAQVRLKAEIGRALRRTYILRRAREQDTAVFQNSTVFGAFHPANQH